MPIVKRNTSDVELVNNNVTGSGHVVRRTNIPIDLYDSNKYGILGSPESARSAGISTRAINIDSYTKYIPKDQLDINLPLSVFDEQRAQNQTKALSGIIIFPCVILLLLSFYLIRRTTRKKFVPANDFFTQNLQNNSK